MAKNLASYCPYPENLNEVDFKANGLICLAEETLSEERIQASDEGTTLIIKQGSTTEEKPPVLHWENGKRTPRARPHPPEAPYHEGFTNVSLESIWMLLWLWYKGGLATEFGNIIHATTALVLKSLKMKT